MLEPPTLRFPPGSKVVPGDRIGTVQQVLPGVGTYARGGNVYASVLGRLEVVPSSTTSSSEKRFVAAIQPPRPLASSQVIRVGQRVLGRVLRVAAPHATVEILAVEGVGNLITPVEGSIPREESVQSGSVVSREIHECFQPSDLVLAKVLSLGDARKYLLTTAEAELGVIHAVCYSSGNAMIPCSWKEMECPETGVKEPRKCAKPRKVLSAIAEKEKAAEEVKMEE